MLNSTSPSKTVLVTGASGFLGSRTVELLSQQGYRVRALVRPTSNISKLQSLSVEIHYGDVADRASLQPAFQGIDYVIHAAADTRGDPEESQRSTVTGTKNMIALAKQHNIKKLIYISSCSVYGVYNLRNNYIIDENTPLEPYPEKRGVYSAAKLAAEKILFDSVKNNAFPFVCLRPGTIWGPGGQLVSPIFGILLANKWFVVFGDGRLVLPLVYIDNLVSAIITCMENDQADGQTFNVLDDTQLTKGEYRKLILKKIYPKSGAIYLPHFFILPAIFFQELVFRLIGRKPFLTNYRYRSAQKKIVYGFSKIKNHLSWQPPVSKEQAIQQVIKSFTRRQQA